MEYFNIDTGICKIIAFYMTHNKLRLLEKIFLEFKCNVRTRKRTTPVDFRIDGLCRYGVVGL